MTLRFRCEHCGKRLQVDEPPGARVMCPYCRGTAAVPPDAVEYRPGDLPQADSRAAEQPAEDSRLVTAAAYLPTWGTSVVLHLAMILVALMGTWVAISTPDKAPIYAKPSPTNRPRLMHTPSRESSRTLTRPINQPVFSLFPDKLKRINPGIVNNNAPRITVIGLTGGIGGAGDPSDYGEWGKGRGRMSGYTDGWFERGDAEVVFVIDRSGSMTDSIMYVKYELKRFLRYLTPREKFHVIFYSTGPAVEMPTGKMVPGVDRNKGLAYDFIDGIVPKGGTDPADALKAAFRLKPQVIHLLTDGEFEHAEQIVKLIDKLNAPDPRNGHKRPVVVNTLCFLYTVGEPICMKIAQRNGGAYRYVSDEDVQSMGR